MKVWSSGQGVGLVAGSREVDKDIVVIGQLRYITCNTSINMLGVTVVFEIFMVCVNCDGVGVPTSK